MHVRTVIISCHKNLQLHACDVVFTSFLAEMWEEGYARCGCMRSLPVKVVAEADLGNLSRMKILEAFNKNK